MKTAKKLVQAIGDTKYIICTFFLNNKKCENHIYKKVHFDVLKPYYLILNIRCVLKKSTVHYKIT